MIPRNRKEILPALLSYAGYAYFMYHIYGAIGVKLEWQRVVLLSILVFLSGLYFHFVWKTGGHE